MDHEDAMILEELVEESVFSIDQQRADQTRFLQQKLIQIEAYGIREQHGDEWIYAFTNRQSQNPSYGFTQSPCHFLRHDLPTIREYIADTSLVTAISLASGDEIEIVLEQGRFTGEMHRIKTSDESREVA